jgi:hypothetical protein
MVNCRGCGFKLSITLLDLGDSPIANNLIEYSNSNLQNHCYPLKAMTCGNCALVQLSEELPREILFKPNYVYYSSFSTSWLEHSKLYAQKMTQFLKLNQSDLVVEVASNDGYLLKYFKSNGIQVLGIEPALGVAEVAIKNGIPTLIDFFGESLALKLTQTKKPKLIIGNNVLAHVPNLHDFISGFATLIDDEGVITFEFPHLLNLLKDIQFDTIYHEHYSYLSITALLPIFKQYKLKVFEVEKLLTHGGSLRIFLAKNNSNWEISHSVQDILEEESQFDPRDTRIYKLLQSKVIKTKSDLVTELSKQKANGKKISAYGAAAKGVTLLNYCGIKSDTIDYVVDLNPSKQGKYLPGCQIPIVDSKMLTSKPPDILLVLAWNLSTELKLQLSDHINLGMKLIKAIPEVVYF